MIPPDVREYFLPSAQETKEAASLVYRPMIIGAAQVCFVDPKAKMNIAEERVFLVPINDSPVPIDWDEAKEANMKLSDLESTPQGDFLYADLPPAALKAKNYVVWEKDFENWLFRTQKIQLFKSARLDELSRPGETERDFRIRLQQSAREKRDQEVDRLREKYSSVLNRLDEKVRKAQMVLDEQSSQARSRKYQAAVSIGETLLGSFLGRKSSTRASRTTREIARISKENRDRKNAEANLKALQQERTRLEAQFQSEVSKTESGTNPLSETLDEVVIAPSKANISVRLLALTWVI